MPCLNDKQACYIRVAGRLPVSGLGSRHTLWKGWRAIRYLRQTFDLWVVSRQMISGISDRQEMSGSGRQASEIRGRRQAYHIKRWQFTIGNSVNIRDERYTF